MRVRGPNRLFRCLVNWPWHCNLSDSHFPNTSQGLWAKQKECLLFVLEVACNQRLLLEFLQRWKKLTDVSNECLCMAPTASFLDQTSCLFCWSLMDIWFIWWYRSSFDLQCFVNPNLATQHFYRKCRCRSKHAFIYILPTGYSPPTLFTPFLYLSICLSHMSFNSEIKQPIYIIIAQFSPLVDIYFIYAYMQKRKE